MAKGKFKQPEKRPKFLTDTIVVKFVDQLNIPYGSNTDLLNNLLPQFGKSLVDMLNKYQEINIGRLVTSITETQMTYLVYEAKERSKQMHTFPGPTGLYNPPNFHNFLKIECKNTTPKFKLLKLLNEQGIVEYAYIQGIILPGSSPPLRSNALKSYKRKQGYLNAGPEGINAKYARANGGRGKGDFRFIDIEEGWDHLDHPHRDLPAGLNINNLLYGVNTGDKLHGNGVLGIILAQDNKFGITGIAPDVRTDVISPFLSTRLGSTRHLEDAIAYANTVLRAGDIVLITLHSQDRGGTLLPVENEQAVFDHIELGIRKGIIYIEIAGNNGIDLDVYRRNKAKPETQLFNRKNFDSGAIIVGAAKRGKIHRRYSSSNHGSRVDCYAWGDNIATTKENSGYTLKFRKTSGAGAIIAGAAIAVQSMYLAKTGRKLDCYEMRKMLSDQATGTPSPDLIGVMPDLKKIAKKINAMAGAA